MAAKRGPRKPSKPSIKKAAGRAGAKSAGAKVALVADPLIAPQEVKRRPGRPSKYDPAFCEFVIDLGEQGKSLTQMASKIGVLKETMMDWAKKHSEFSAAVDMALQLSQAWWEDRGQEGIAMGKDFNGFVYSFQMKNRFRGEYSEKFEVKHDATAAFAQCWQAIGTGQMGAR